MPRDIKQDTRDQLRYVRAVDRLEEAAGAASRLEDAGLESEARRALEDARAAIGDAAAAYGSLRRQR